VGALVVLVFFWLRVLDKAEYLAFESTLNSSIVSYRRPTYLLDYVITVPSFKDEVSLFIHHQPTAGEILDRCRAQHALKQSSQRILSVGKDDEFMRSVCVVLKLPLSLLLLVNFNSSTPAAVIMIFASRNVPSEGASRGPSKKIF